MGTKRCRCKGREDSDSGPAAPHRDDPRCAEADATWAVSQSCSVQAVFTACRSEARTRAAGGAGPGDDRPDGRSASCPGRCWVCRNTAGFCGCRAHDAAGLGLGPLEHLCHRADRPLASPDFLQRIKAITRGVDLRAARGPTPRRGAPAPWALAWGDSAAAAVTHTVTGAGDGWKKRVGLDYKSEI